MEHREIPAVPKRSQEWPAIQELGFDVRFKRMWEYYLAYCRAGFEAGVLNVGLYKIAQTS
jgi:cyclopropane-fatty-acyl-phospholipid synthase